MKPSPAILKSNDTLTPYKFYTDFLVDVANYYKQNKDGIIAFQLFEKGDDNFYDAVYRIEPISIPLLLSLFEQLSKFHKTPLLLHLNNNRATIDVLEFLFRSGFFDIAGDNKVPRIPKGRNILDFERKFLGAFKDKNIREEHRVRAYSRSDEGVHNELKNYLTEDNKRDFLISHYTYKTREHFQELLFDNQFTAYYHNLYLDILSELITNSVLHSGSTAFALMFVDRYRTKFSISDNGVGFAGSMKKKEPTPFYQTDVLKKHLSQKVNLRNIPNAITENLFTILDTLYYSSLKDRHGLFDLMLTVVLNGNGYFRIHSENSQLIISNRMIDELHQLDVLRSKIYELHVQKDLEQINSSQWEIEIKKLSNQMFSSFVVFCDKSLAKYSSDIKFSSIRFFPVKFRGVHIEVEIPNGLNDDNISN